MASCPCVGLQLPALPQLVPPTCAGRHNLNTNDVKMHKLLNDVSAASVQRKFQLVKKQTGNRSQPDL